MREIWEKIKNFEDYEVSNLGNYRSLKKESVYPMKPKKNKAGYLQARLTQNGKHYYFYLHRLVAQAFISNPENKFYINHINGNKGDNNVNNLEWCTAKENTRHLFDILGCTYTSERNSRISKRLKGHVVSEETRQKLRAAMLKRREVISHE